MCSELLHGAIIRLLAAMGEVGKKGKKMRWLSCFVVLRCAVVLGLAYSGYVVAATGGAEVVLVIGKAEVREAEGGEWKPVREQQQLPAGASVRTGDSSQVGLLLKDQTQIRVNQQSVLKFTAALDAEQETSVDLLQGRIWAQLKRTLRAVTALTRAAQPRALRLNTPVATIGIRGTDWDVEVGENGKTQVTVLSGEVEMTNDFGGVNIGPNEQATAEAGKGPIKRLLSDASDRVQWVTAYHPSPRRWVKTPPASLAPAVQAIETGDYASALKRLETQARQ
jgi:hypothetical protein